jgi:hypothetical protein
MTSPRRVARGRGMQSLELKPQRQRVRMPRRAPVGPPKMGGPLPPTRVRVAQPIQFTTPPNRPTMPPPQQVRGDAGLQTRLELKPQRQRVEPTQEQLEDLRQAQERYNLMMQDSELISDMNQRNMKLMMEKAKKQRPLFEQFQRGEISVKDLKGSGLFTPQQLREARRNRRMQRMSPEERLNFMRREAERRKRRLGRRRRRPLGLGTANRPLKAAPQRPRRIPRRGSMQSLELKPQRRRVRIGRVR